MFRNPLEEQGGERAVCTVRTTPFPKKNALSVHYVPTTSARTPVAHRVQERIACPSWGAPPRGPKTWVMDPAFSGVPKVKGDKIRIGRAHKWAEMLHHPCILGGPQSQEEQNQNWWSPQVGGNATSPLHSRGPQSQGGTKPELAGPTSGQKCYITPAFSGIPNKEDKVKAQKQKSKKNKTKISRRLTPVGFEPKTFQLQRHCFTH